MEKRYQFKENDSKIYQMWEKNGYFKPVFKKKGGKFCIIMPPPNANNPLHIGHAVFVTLEDILIRYNRMRGKTTLWLPGADHAGFETQVVFEKNLEKQGKSRFQFPKDVLYKMIWNYTQKNKIIMEDQLRKLGASCDWSRKKFTLDPDIIKVVNFTFKNLLEDGLVYRGKRMVNWCCHHQTSLSDLEVLKKEEKTKLVYIKYPIKDSKKFIVVATTRPETMLGDTAVAVNPKDKRYQELLKKKVKIELPLTKRIIPLIADKAVDPEFGTGAVKVTPAHDFTDFEIGQRHNLETIQVIEKNGKMTKEAGPDYFGLKVKQAKEKVIEDLRNLNLIEKEEDYSHFIPLCYKCKNLIEPLVSDQWFIKIAPLAQKAVTAVKEKKVKFVSKHFEKIFFHWMKNIKDWNISRQIVWGIKIPVWYCQERKTKKCQLKEGIIFSEEKLKKCPYCQSEKLKEETDTFDTWFSSGQWPFATLLMSGRSKSKTSEAISLGCCGAGKNKKSKIPWTTKDFEEFYPTSVMETGWDILFFWVARMLMLGIYIVGKEPFKYVYLHGLVCDEARQKMSKSKGNVIDPLGLIEIYGADALRMALIFGSNLEKDIIISENKVAAQQKFITKIWNAARFIFQNLEKDFNPKKIKRKNLQLTKNDKWILKELKTTIRKITKDIDNFKFHLAGKEIYHFFWHKFCDKTIEDTKNRLFSESSFKEKQTAKFILYNVLLNSLKLLHPFCPFITEAIYQKLPFKAKKALIIENWPKDCSGI